MWLSLYKMLEDVLRLISADSVQIHVGRLRIKGKA
jgi:hypothetical protein